MRTPRHFRCLGFAAAIAILPAAAVVTHQEDLDDFGRLAAAALDGVGHFDAPPENASDIPPIDNKMLLDWGRPGRKHDFPFYGDRPGTFIGVHCEQSQEFRIIANGNDQAQFNVGACKQEAGRARDLAAHAGAATKAAFGPMPPGVPAASREKLEQLERLIADRKVALRGGMTGYAFTMVAVGHGVEFVNEALVFDPSRDMAFIVEGDVGMLCGHSNPSGKSPFAGSPFCSDTAKALLDVAIDLARRYK